VPDTLKQRFLTAISSDAIYTSASFKNNLPSNVNGFFFQNENGELNFKFIEIGIKTGLQSEIIRFLDGSELMEGIKVINGIKSK